MVGYFGDEPTCRRCDYPRRLHHLIRVDHDYEDAPGPAATGTEGEETTNQQEGDSMSNDTAPNGVITPVRTAEENVRTLEPADNEDAGQSFLLAEVTRGVFTARIWRYDYLEDGRIGSEPLEITIDSTGMKGGEMFHDLCVFSDQLEDFRYVTAAIVDAHTYLSGGAQ